MSTQTHQLLPATVPTEQLLQVLDVMAEVVRDHGPDHVYGKERRKDRMPTCYYANADRTGPACLVGHVMWRFGWTITDLESVEHSGVDCRWGRFRELDGEVTTVLAVAQTAQDGGKTWGEALREARWASGLYPDVG